MIYHYLIKIRYIKGKEYILKEYRKMFCEVGNFFVKLEEKHGNNYQLLSIKPLYYQNGYQKIARL